MTEKQSKTLLYRKIKDSLLGLTLESKDFQEDWNAAGL